MTDALFYSALAVLDEEIERFAHKPHYLDVGHDRVAKPNELWYKHKTEGMQYLPGVQGHDVIHSDWVRNNKHKEADVSHLGRIDHDKKRISIRPISKAHEHPDSMKPVVRTLPGDTPIYDIHEYEY